MWLIENRDLTWCQLCSHGWHTTVSNHWQLDCFLNSLFRQTRKEISMPRSSDLLWGVDSIHKKAMMRGVFLCHGVTMFLVSIPLFNAVKWQHLTRIMAAWLEMQGLNCSCGNNSLGNLGKCQRYSCPYAHYIPWVRHIVRILPCEFLWFCSEPSYPFGPGFSLAL